MCPSLIASSDTEGAGPSDPLAALEKTTDAQNHVAKVQLPRLEALQAVSEATNGDPWAHSRRIRKRFREEKKVEQAKTAADDAIKNKYSLPAELALIRDDEESTKAAKEEWEAAKRAVAERESAKRRKVVGGASTVPVLPARAVARSVGGTGKGSSGLNALRARILENTARQSVARRKP
jgi:coiled-coil domain-containing protein 130